MHEQQVWAFVLASIVLIVVPGVDMALVTRQVAVHGRRVALATLPGLLAAGLTHAAFAALGLTAVLLTSATVYNAIKLIGAAYLVVLGVRTLLATRHRDAAGVGGAGAAGRSRHAPPMSLRRAFALGLASNLTNPKMAVFFLTFLPQFVSPGPHATAQIALLGLLFNAMATTWWIVYVLVTARIVGWLDHPAVRRALERLTGIILVALGIRLAVERR